MKNDTLCYAAAALISVAWLLSPGRTHAAKDRNLSINIEGNAEHCSDLKASSKNGEIAQAADTYTLQKSEAPVLELNGMDKGILKVRGWDRPEYSVEACKIAVADNRAAAEQAVRGISVNRSAGRFSMTGPSSDDVTWQLYFIVHAPKGASLDLETKNGPISVSGIQGNVKVRATNGPVSVNDSAGLIEVHTSNGPISFNGGGGEVHLTATNGPISLNLAGDLWNGPKLEAHTNNGPVSVNMPETYRTGVRVETSGRSPISCRAGACQNAWTNNSETQRVIQLNGAQDTIRVSTNNGPVSVNGSNKARRVI